MHENRIMTRWLSLLAVFGCFLPLNDAAAITAQEYFADGNRLFRDDLYWAALLRYGQAAGEGMDTAALHYNTGVAHYRAGQHIRARESLTKAAGDASLGLAAQYNLGLNAYALGQTDEALRWFRLVRDQDRNERLQEFAVIAISRILDEQAEPDDFEVRLVEREEKRNLADLELRLSVGYGNDDNVFRTPGRPYVDRSDPDNPVVVNPVVQSGSFVPVYLSAKYRVNTLPFEGFYVAYRLAGRVYQDEGLGNADEVRNEISFGSEYRRKEGSREREVYSAFKVARHDEIYYDPDTGNGRDVDGDSISDRMNFLRYGPELRFRQSHEKLAIGANFKGQLWNYDDPVLVPEYDHEFISLSLFGQYKFAPTSLLRITLDGYTRRYGDRPAFDLDGNQPITNPDLHYNYYSLELTARQRVLDDLWFGFNIERTERIDQYVGYNDYTRDSVSGEVHWSPGERFDVELNGAYYLYDFPNAFAFHNPAGARKTQESAGARLIATFRVTPRLSLVAEARYRETVSNDTRIQYARNQFLLGVRWDQ